MKVKGVHTTTLSKEEAKEESKSLPNIQTDAVAISVYRNANGDYFVVQIPFNRETLQLGPPVAEDVGPRFRDEAITKFKMLAVEKDLV